MTWEKVVPPTSPPHTCDLPTTLEAGQGTGSIWFCECERRYVLNLKDNNEISWANA
jgi:hypothetical protein